MGVVDRKLIEKYHLEEARKRFQQICEYSFITQPTLNEEGDDDENGPQQPNQQNGGQQPMGNGDMGQSMDNGGMQQPQYNQSQEGQPQQGMEQPMPQQGAPMGGDEGGMPPMDDGMDGEGVDFGETEPMQPDDEVISVDDLTQSQEAAEYKIDGVNDKLTTLLNVVTKFTQALEQSDEKINDLKAEIERRNPTEQEKLNIRSQSGSSPYSVNPTEYWDNVKDNSNYDVIYDNDVDPDKEDKEYTITKSDIKGIDGHDVARSFDEYPNKLSDYLNF